VPILRLAEVSDEICAASRGDGFSLAFPAYGMQCEVSIRMPADSFVKLIHNRSGKSNPTVVGDRKFALIRMRYGFPVVIRAEEMRIMER